MSDNKKVKNVLKDKTNIYYNQIENVIVEILNRLLSSDTDDARQLTYYRDEWEVRNYNQLLLIEKRYDYTDITGFSNELVARRGMDGLMINQLIDLGKTYMGSEQDEVPKSIKNKVMELFASK